MTHRSKRTVHVLRAAGGGALVALVAVLFGCAHSKGAKTASSDTSTSSAGASVTNPTSAEPEHIQVQHCLIGFKGSVPGKPITRTQEEAKTLAYDVLERAKKGESFDELIQKYTDDSPPGIYGMSNLGVTPDAAKQEYKRDGMVAAFGDVGFKLAVGEYGIADYDPRTSPFGYHVIKRLR
jgi:hypothetical protein